MNKIKIRQTDLFKMKKEWKSIFSKMSSSTNIDEKWKTFESLLIYENSDKFDRCKLACFDLVIGWDETLLK